MISAMITKVEALDLMVDKVEVPDPMVDKVALVKQVEGPDPMVDKVALVKQVEEISKDLEVLVQLFPAQRKDLFLEINAMNFTGEIERHFLIQKITESVG